MPSALCSIEKAERSPAAARVLEMLMTLPKDCAREIV